MPKYKTEKKGTYNKDSEIIKEAQERFEESEDGSNFNRRTAEDDIKFARLSEQWPNDIKKAREQDSRPCLTINKLPAMIRQVINEARQNKPGIVVSPIDNGADPDTAEVITGLIRSIERNSNADVAYDTAIDNSASCGFGFFQLSIVDADNTSFDKEARIETVPNPLSVHWDVNDTGMDATNWDYAFISEMISDEKFKHTYPGASPVSFDGDTDDRESWWRSDDGIRVAAYWLKEEDKDTLLMIRDEQNPMQEPLVIKKSDFDKNEELQMMIQSGLWQVARERAIIVPRVMRRLITASEILEEEEWPGPTIPICPVWGEVIDLGERRYLRSMIRDARDPQIMFNYWRTCATELVALAPKAPWVGPEGFIPDGQAAKWESSNIKNYNTLEYAGDIPPQRQPFAGVPAGALQEALNASDDIKAITGIYDAALGARSNETSGKAIQARQRESDVSNFHFVDNLSRAIRYGAKCLVDIIPSVYNTRQMIRILGEDMKEKVIRLAGQQNQMLLEQGEIKEKLYDLSVGKYDVTVKAGPSYSSQREEAREVFIEMMRAMPQVAPYISDFLMDNMDFQGAEKLSKRLKLLLPPHIQQMETKEDTKDLPPEFQQALQQAEMIIKDLEAKLKEAMNEQAPEMARLNLEKMKMEREMQGDGAKVNSETAKAQAEALKAENESKKIEMDMSLKQEANNLQARKLDLEERKLELEERKISIDELNALKEPEPIEMGLSEYSSKEPNEPQEDDGAKQVIVDALVNLARTQQAPIKIKRGKNGKITGAERVMDELPTESINQDAL